MNNTYIIAGCEFQRKDIIDLSAEEQDCLLQGKLVIKRKIAWPVQNTIPYFEKAYIDPGGTDIWGPGPYLKVPNKRIDDNEEYVNRVFCPWGYPGDIIRVSGNQRVFTIKNVDIIKENDDWFWNIALSQSNENVRA